MGELKNIATHVKSLRKIENLIDTTKNSIFKKMVITAGFMNYCQTIRKTDVEILDYTISIVT